MPHTIANTKKEHTIKDLQMFDVNYALAIGKDKRWELGNVLKNEKKTVEPSYVPYKFKGSET